MTKEQKALSDKTPVKLTLKMALWIICVVGATCFAVGKYVANTATKIENLAISQKQAAIEQKQTTENQLAIVSILKDVQKNSNHCATDLITEPADVREAMRN